MRSIGSITGRKAAVMGIFGRKKEEPVKIILPKGARCCRCGKKIKKGSEFMYIDGKLYCEKCGKAKRDWDFLEMMALFED